MDIPCSQSSVCPTVGSMRVGMMTVALLIGLPAAAEPVSVATSMDVGQGLAPDESGRVGLTVGARTQTGPWTYGAELGGSYGQYLGGWTCDADGEPGAVVPAIAHSCQRPGLAGHLLGGLALLSSPWLHARVEVGAGAAAIWVPKYRSHDPWLRPSTLARASFLVRLGENSPWATGLRVQQQVLGARDWQWNAAVGWTLEIAVP